MSTKSRRVLRLPATEEEPGLKRDAIYRLGRLGKFPRHVKLTKHASGWFEDESMLGSPNVRRSAGRREGHRALTH